MRRGGAGLPAGQRWRCAAALGEGKLGLEGGLCSLRGLGSVWIKPESG